MEETDKLSSKTLAGLRKWERWFWVLFAFLLSGRMWLLLLRYGPRSPWELFPQFYPNAVACLIFLILPWLYFKIFGDYPISRRARRGASSVPPSIRVDQVTGDLYVTADGVSDGESWLSSTKPLELLRSMAIGSELAADRLYNRSGLYLLVGVMTALLGLAFFYLQGPIVPDVGSLSSKLFAISPRFGMFLFVEFIAFFFLRHYRAAMEESRHFEAIQRQWEDNLTIFSISSEEDLDFKERLELVKASSFSKGALESGLPESGRKLGGQLAPEELALLENIVGVLTSSGIRLQ